MTADESTAGVPPRAVPPLPSHKKVLARSTVASIIATGSEFALLPILTRLLHVRHEVAYASVQFVANAITFLLYKYWAFDAAEVGRIETQYAKQLVIFAGSLLLNTAIPWLLADHWKLMAPELGFLVSQVVVYVGWNYPGNRYWVFKR
jgi:putative flippase GtrA